MRRTRDKRYAIEDPTFFQLALEVSGMGCFLDNACRSLIGATTRFLSLTRIKFQIIGPVLLCKTILKQRNFFLWSVATDGRDQETH